MKHFVLGFISAVACILAAGWAGAAFFEYRRLPEHLRPPKDQKTRKTAPQPPIQP
jgi:hypothetical protein